MAKKLHVFRRWLNNPPKPGYVRAYVIGTWEPTSKDVDFVESPYLEIGDCSRHVILDFSPGPRGRIGSRKKIAALHDALDRISGFLDLAEAEVDRLAAAKKAKKAKRDGE